MRAMKFILAIGLIAWTSQLARADGPDPAHTTVMPTLDVSNQPVDKVLEQLRSSLPWFHYVIFRQTGAPKDEPKLPAMSLDGVTVEQFLHLITDEFPTTVSIKKIDGDKTPLYEVNIADPNKLPWKDTEAGRAAASEPVMKVFPLADIVTRMNGAADPKKAMDDILSLVQAALDESGGDTKNPPVLKVHQPTQTLIFKGSPEKLAVLTQVLDALKPKEPSESEKVLKLQADLESSSIVKARLEAQIQQMDMEIALLKQQSARVNSRLDEYVNRYGAGLPKQSTTSTQPSK